MIKCGCLTIDINIE